MKPNTANKLTDNTQDITELEQMFLGSLLIPGQNIPALTIKPHHFENSKNGSIFQTYSKQKKDGKEPDISTLCFDPDLANIGKDYISSLTDKIPTVANIQYYEEAIINAWKVRTCKFAIEKFQEKIRAPENADNIEPVIQEFQGILSGALGDKQSSSFLSFDDYINSQANKEYWREYTPKLFGTLPFPDGTISAIGAAPGSGKSAALINLCRELLTTKATNTPKPGEKDRAQAIDAKRKILFISAEMSAQDITNRLIHSLAWQTAGKGEPYFLDKVPHTNIDYWKAIKYKYGAPPEHWEYTPQEIMRAELYRGIIEKYIRPTWGDRLKIAYTRGRKSFDDIYNIITNNAEPGTIVLMDYLQLLPICAADIGQGNPRYLEIRHIMDMAIIAAEKTKSVIIAAAQLGREERTGRNRGDDTQGWRESGDIEQTAWNLIKLTRENDSISFRITKARSSGGIDTAFKMKWIPSYQYMENSKEKVTAKSSNNDGTSSVKDGHNYGLNNG